MDHQNSEPGYPFGDDYSESYDYRSEKLQRILRRQLEELGRSGQECRAAELLGILRGRRGDNPDLVQLVSVPRRAGALPALAARGELMMKFSSYAKSSVRTTVADRGFVGDVPAARRSDLVHLRHRDMLVPRVDDLLADTDARHNYVMTMAAVGKGIGGPEPLEGTFDSGPTAPVTGPPVAVIDTGIVRAQRGDDWLHNVRRADNNIDRLDVFPAPDGFLDFQAGHGTFVAGIVQRVAAGADIRMYQAADTDGFASDVAIADAIERAHEDQAKIINLSLGGLTVDNKPPPAMKETIERIYRRDDEAVFVAAAGNFGSDPAPCWPAALPEVLAVAGLTEDLEGAEWSNRGDVQFSTVAEGIRSTFVTGCESPVFDREPETFGPDAWALWTGTSFAAPQVAGGIWRLCQELELTPREAAVKLAGRGKPIPDYGQGVRILHGIGR